MNPNVLAGTSENPVKEGLLSLIQGIRNIKNFSGTLQDIPDELQQMLQSLEGQGVDFNGISALQGQELLKQLEESFRDNFNGTKDLLRGVSSIFSDAAQSNINLSPEAQEIQKKFNVWLKNNEAYAKEHKIKENVTITNDGIQLGEVTLYWKGHQFGGVNVSSEEDLKKQPYTIEQMGDMMQALGGQELKLRSGSNLGGKEISSFLSEVANIELGKFYWSSSRRVNGGVRVWGVRMNHSEVYVFYDLRNNDNSSLSSQN